MQRPVRVGLVGSQFISTIHAEAMRQCPGAGRKISLPFLTDAARPIDLRLDALAQRAAKDAAP